VALLQRPAVLGCLQLLLTAKCGAGTLRFNGDGSEQTRGKKNTTTRITRCTWRTFNGAVPVATLPSLSDGTVPAR